MLEIFFGIHPDQVLRQVVVADTEVERYIGRGDISRLDWLPASPFDIDLDRLAVTVTCRFFVVAVSNDNQQ